MSVTISAVPSAEQARPRPGRLSTCAYVKSQASVCWHGDRCPEAGMGQTPTPTAHGPRKDKEPPRASL